MASSDFLPQQNRAQKDAPLGGIDVNQYTYSNFIYPRDLGTEGSGFNHYIVFYINETTTTQFKTRTAGSASPTDPPAIIANKQKDDKFGKSAEEQSDLDKQNKFFANDLSTSIAPSAFQAVQQPIKRVATTIVLYMPPEIVTNYQAQWAEAELGASADVLNQITGQGSLKDTLTSLGVSLFGNGGAMLDTFTNLSLSDAFGRKGRLAINPHLEVLFRGVGFRTFQFTFRFTPQTEEDAENVDNIIQAFKFYAAPEILQGSSGRIWLYPAEFDIQFISNGQENQFLNKISTCALTDISVNYTAAGHWSAHRQHSRVQGAPPTVTDLSLTFKELEIMSKRRILDGY